jgi:hypothetical protein
VSHQPERKAKDCLNCGVTVHGRFCHVCGQENIATHQNFAGLIKHFIYDIFHFDGKFFDTLKFLIVKPGFVAKQYVKGKRVSYLDPIRMYLFTSAVFFVLFFSIAKPDVNVSSTPETFLTRQERLELIEELKKEQKPGSNDSILLNDLAILMDTIKPLRKSELKSVPEDVFLNISGAGTYKTVEEYDSIQKQAPSKERHGWFKRQLVKKSISINSRYGGNVEEGIRKLWDIFIHRIPYVLFVSLPFFALILKLLYTRRKNFFYSDHAVFTLYHYIFSFFILIFTFVFGRLGKWLGWQVFNWLLALLYLFWFFYLYKSLRNFYGQRRAKTIGKFILLNILGFVTILILFLVFIFFSIFQL